MTSLSTSAPVMQTIGLLGGMSWESSAHYYRLLNEGVRERLGGLHSARCLLASVDFAEIAALQSAARWDEAGRRLAGLARGLEAAGADLMLICTNTMHLVADQVQAALSIPLIHIADVAGEAARRGGLSTIGLLGTAFTMDQAFYRDRLAQHGLTVLVPDESDRHFIHQVIFTELCVGVVRDESREGYRAVIGRLIDAGAEGIVLGCTEIELLIDQFDSPVPVYPTTLLHVQRALDAAFAPRLGKP